MYRPGSAPRGEFLWQGSCPDRDVVMVPVRAFYTDPVYGIAYPVDLAGNGPGQEVERDFALCYGFTLRHLYACLRTPVPGIRGPARFDPGQAGLSFFSANMNGIIS